MSAPFRWIGLGVGEALAISPFDGTLKRVDPALRGESPDLRIATIVDVETTGLDESAKVIEFASSSILYDRTNGEVLGEAGRYSSFIDPGQPLSDEIQRLTGITDADVSGAVLDEAKVSATLAASDVVIAHNAKFDRPRVDALLKFPPRVAWVCSCEMIGWRAMGLPSSSLEALCWAHGFYGAAHRAMGDVAALAKLLSTKNAETGRTYLAHLLDAARTPSVRLIAVNPPREANDRLKARGYRWNPTRRAWWTEVPEVKGAEESAWLGGFASVSIEPVDRFSRFARTGT